MRLGSRDFIAGAVMVALGLGLLFVLIPLGVDEPRKVKYAALSPSYYPRIVAIALLALGLVVTIKALRNADIEDGPATDTHPNAAIRIAMMFGILLFYALTVSLLGFVLSSTLALGAAFYLAGERKHLLIALLAILIPILLYLFFLKVARIPIPMGVLEPILRGI